MKQTTDKPKLIENNLGSILHERGITKYFMAKEMGKHWNTIDSWTKAETMNSSDMRLCADYLQMEVSQIFKI